MGMIKSKSVQLQPYYLTCHNNEMAMIMVIEIMINNIQVMTISMFKATKTCLSQNVNWLRAANNCLCSFLIFFRTVSKISQQHQHQVLRNRRTITVGVLSDINLSKISIQKIYFMVSYTCDQANRTASILVCAKMNNFLETCVHHFWKIGTRVCILG